MSCGNGGNGCTACCSKCGCCATCTCESMWFDETIDDFRSYSVILTVGETGKSGAFIACPTGTCASEGSFSTDLYLGENDARRN